MLVATTVTVLLISDAVSLVSRQRMPVILVQAVCST